MQDAQIIDLDESSSTLTDVLKTSRSAVLTDVLSKWLHYIWITIC